MDLILFRHSPSVLKWILLTRYFEDAGDTRALLATETTHLSISLACHSSSTTAISHLPPDDVFFKIIFTNKFSTLDPDTSLQFDLHL